MGSERSEKVESASALGTDNAIRVQETSPDMLRNTPSNIRRLVSEIEQFEGRHKYLAQTRSSSDGGDFRWYFCKVPFSVNGEHRENMDFFYVSVSVYTFFFILLSIYFVVIEFLFLCPIESSQFLLSDPNTLLEK